MRFFWSKIHPHAKPKKDGWPWCIMHPYLDLYGNFFASWKLKISFCITTLLCLKRLWDFQSNFKVFWLDTRDELYLKTQIEISFICLCFVILAISLFHLKVLSYTCLHLHSVKLLSFAKAAKFKCDLTGTIKFQI